MTATARAATRATDSWPRLGDVATSRFDATAPGRSVPPASHDAPNACLTAAEYEGWLLPPEPRDAMERTVHAMSLSAGVLAFTGGLALLWLIL